jgi:hypothetical protein
VKLAKFFNQFLVVLLIFWVYVARDVLVRENVAALDLFLIGQLPLLQFSDLNNLRSHFHIFLCELLSFDRVALLHDRHQLSQVVSFLLQL